MYGRERRSIQLPEPQIGITVCPDCKGNRTKDDEDGVPMPCKTCGGMGETCECCGKRRYLCRKLIEHYG